MAQRTESSSTYMLRDDDIDSGFEVGAVEARSHQVEPPAYSQHGVTTACTAHDSNPRGHCRIRYHLKSVLNANSTKSLFFLNFFELTKDFEMVHRAQQ